MSLSIESDIRSWSKEVLEVSNPHLNGLPACPYARKAWLSDKVKVLEVDNVLLSALEQRHLLSKYDLVIVASYTIPDAETMQAMIEHYNDLGAHEDLHFMLFPPDYGAEDAELDFLYEHNWESGLEDYCMIFIQSLAQVDDASKQLEEKGYYDTFPEHEYQTLVLDRRNRRHGNETPSYEKGCQDDAWWQSDCP